MSSSWCEASNFDFASVSKSLIQLLINKSGPELYEKEEYLIIKLKIMLKSYSVACITVVTILLASSVYSLLRGLSGPPRLLKMIHISFASFLRKFIATFFFSTYYVCVIYR